MEIKLIVKPFSKSNLEAVETCWVDTPKDAILFKPVTLTGTYYYAPVEDHNLGAFFNLILFKGKTSHYFVERWSAEAHLYTDDKTLVDLVKDEIEAHGEYVVTVTTE